MLESKSNAASTWHDAEREWMRHLSFIPASGHVPARLILDTKHLVPASSDGISTESNHIDLDPMPSASTLLRIARDPAIAAFRQLTTALADATDNLAQALDSAGIDPTDALALVRALRSPRGIPTCDQMGLVGRVGLSCAHLAMRLAKPRASRTATDKAVTTTAVEHLNSIATTTFESLVSLWELIRLPEGHREAEACIEAIPEARALRARIRQKTEIYWKLKSTGTNDQLVQLRSLEDDLRRDQLALAPIENSVRGDMASRMATQLADCLTALREAYVPMQFHLAGIVQKEGRSYCSGRWKGTNALEVLISIADKVISTKGELSPSTCLDAIAWADLKHDITIDLCELRRQSSAEPFAAASPAAILATALPELEVNSFRRDGSVWTAVFGGQRVGVKDLRGCHYIHALLMRPNEPVSTQDLQKCIRPTFAQVVDRHSAASEDLREMCGSGNGVDDGTYDALLSDPDFRKLQRQMQDAEALDKWDDAEQLRATLLDRLSETGKHRRGPQTQQAKELKAVTKAVGNALQDAMKHIAEVHPSLGSHLRNYIKGPTSRSPMYAPPPGVTWMQ